MEHPLALASAQPSPHLRSEQPTFLGIVRGELFKISRQRTTLVMAALLLVILFFPYVLAAGSSATRDGLHGAPRETLYLMMEGGLGALRIFAGVFLIMLSARLIGMEFIYGTVRVLIGRGVARGQLVVAKLCVALLVASAVLLVGLAVNALAALLTIAALTGGFDALTSLNATFWSDTALYIVTVAISMAISILMAVAVSVATRSLAVGLTVATVFFAVDNTAVEFLAIVTRLTHADLWSSVTGGLLGPILNVMPATFLSSHAPPFILLATPLVQVNAAQTLAVTLAWAALFTAIVIIFIWRRDIQE